MFDLTLVSLWNDGVHINPLYHFIRTEIETVSKVITNDKLKKAGKLREELKSDEAEVVRYRKKYPFAPALLALGSSLINNNYSVDFVCMDYEREKYKNSEDWMIDTVKYICKNTRVAILVSVVTPEIDNLKLFCKCVKRIRSDLKIVVGGVHATYYDKQMLEELEVDIICRGEGEIVVPNLISALVNNNDLGTVKGISYKKHDIIIRNEEQELLCDLKDVPIPCYEALDKNLLNKIIITPTFSRGCPYGCSYCVESHFWKVVNRHKNPKKFVDELEVLNKKLKMSFIHIADSTFGLNKVELEELCSELEKRKLNCYFSINIRPDVFEYLGEFWVKRLLDLNFVEFCMGVESASIDTIHNLKRKQEENIVYQTLLKLKEIGIPIVKLYLMIGCPGDNNQTLFNTIMTVKEYLENDLIMYATGKFFVPAPGTPLFNEMNSRIEEKWSLYDRYNFPPIYESSELSAPELDIYLMLLQAVQLREYEKYLDDKEITDMKARLRNYCETNYLRELYF